jgi:hypothetical protein
MGRLTSLLISNLSSNAFEVKFNNVDINKTDNETVRGAEKFEEIKQKAYQEALYQDVIDEVARFFEIKQITNQLQIK